MGLCGRLHQLQKIKLSGPDPIVTVTQSAENTGDIMTLQISGFSLRVTELNPFDTEEYENSSMSISAVKIN